MVRTFTALKKKALRKTPSAAQYVGVALVAGGFFLLAPWLGLVISGLLLFAIGFIADGEDS